MTNKPTQEEAQAIREAVDSHWDFIDDFGNECIAFDSDEHRRAYHKAAEVLSNTPEAPSSDKSDDRREALEAYKRLKNDLYDFWRGKDASDKKIEQYYNDDLLIRAALSQPDDVGELVSKAKAVVDRWDTPKWKDEPHTAEFINDLRKALSKHTEKE